MKKLNAYIFAIAIFIADQVTKYAMLNIARIREVRQIEIIEIFNFTYVENRGISLGLLQAEDDLGRWLLVGATAAIAAIVGWWMTRETQKWDQLGLAMILGGALGNIVDRVRFGYVVDFLDLHFGDFRPFYVFNIADAAISIGVVILLIRAFFFAPAEENEHA
ncbi:signal peptidase II [Sphingomicrobium flavum]|uniref:signal peptidase II n=1 Tax=Sphingomicrobium flavum TaxID=1229164 RepID=UPI0021AD52BC|nr:signal peptidase II [Sphingomicrobium flavum]